MSDIRLLLKVNPGGMGKGKSARFAHITSGPVPRAAVGRLSLYLRQLETLLEAGHQTTSSHQIGAALGVSDAQVRKDLAYFGQFGHPGVGYDVGDLMNAIRRILGTDRSWSVALVGVGNLGRALLGYRGFRKRGFHIEFLFDNDPAKVGTTFEGLTVHRLDDLPSVSSVHKIKLAAIAVPAVDAQVVAELLVRCGVEGILNFAPVTLSLPPHVRLVEVDLAIQLEQLAFYIGEGVSPHAKPGPEGGE